MIEEQEVRVNADLQAEHGLSSLKRAREDLGVEDRGKTHSMNFKSTLLKTTNEVTTAKVEEAPKSYGHWLAVSYNRNNRNMANQKNHRYEGRTERGVKEEIRFKDPKNTEGEGRNNQK
ncbi:hypothetical protein ACOSP7_004856 [Xanthoceras sorbifolium]